MSSSMWMYEYFSGKTRAKQLRVARQGTPRYRNRHDSTALLRNVELSNTSCTRAHNLSPVHHAHSQAVTLSAGLREPINTRHARPP